MAKHTTPPVLPTLVVKNLAQIKSASIELGDFTLLVGPQASGKSILPQLLKLVRVRNYRRTRNGFAPKSDRSIDGYFFRIGVPRL